MRSAVMALAIFLLIMNPVCAMAYIGPGLATGTIGVILGVLGSLCIAVFALVWYPIKRVLKKIKKSSPKENRQSPE
ncbi:hypothetical protein [Desulfobacter postgatei]|uniref:hypothetical protein n=1 Tax=Desulfobacter postgatei TaxID=2293 RepID=UPI00259B0AC1|nr:hypothetical protein [uncultured Desulfobacter sp.]